MPNFPAATDTSTPEMLVIAAAAAMLDDALADDASNPVLRTALTGLTLSTPEHAEEALGRFIAVLSEGSRAGSTVAEEAYQVLVNLRGRLRGWQAGWLGRTGTITVPVVEFDEEGTASVVKELVIEV